MRRQNPSIISMKTIRLYFLFLGAYCLQNLVVLALSTPIGRDINFPKNYDPQKAEAIRSVIRDQRFKFVGGIVSYWEPDFGTRLSFDGDAKSFNDFCGALRELHGLSMRLTLYYGHD